MAGFLVAAAEAVRATQCQLLAANEYVVGSVGRFSGPVRSRALEGLGAIRRLTGCAPEGDVPPPPPPFTGGQCAGATYSVPYGQIIGGECGALNNISGVIGPITQASVTTAPSGNFPNTIAGTITVVGANGTFTRNQPGSEANPPCVGTPVRTDGGTDDCGDPDPEFPPPSNFEITIPITYNIDNGDEVTINIPFVFQPIDVDFDGNFRVPFTFDFGGNTFDGSFSLNPSLPVTFNFPGLNVGDGQGIDTLPPGDPGDEVPPLPPEQKIIGVVVNILSVDNRKVTELSSPGIPDLLVPRAGSVKFAYSLGLATFWSSDIDIKDGRTFIPCPFSQGADAVIASPQIGVNLTFVPIRGQRLATVADLRAP